MATQLVIGMRELREGIDRLGIVKARGHALRQLSDVLERLESAEARIASSLEVGQEIAAQEGRRRSDNRYAS